MCIHYKIKASDVVHAKSIDKTKIESAVTSAAARYARAKAFDAHIPGWVIHCESAAHVDDKFATIVDIEEE